MKIRSHCPINYTLEHFGDKWSMLILRDLMFKGKRHYNEFLESEEKISTSVLGSRLKMLEEVGIIQKGEDEKKKSRIKYSLTTKGIDMLPILLEMIQWGGFYDQDTEAGEDFLSRLKTNKAQMILNLRTQLEKDHLG